MKDQIFMTAPDYLYVAVSGFVDDPADSDYQRGYLAGLLAIAEEIGVDLGSEPFCLVRHQTRAPSARNGRLEA